MPLQPSPYLLLAASALFWGGTPCSSPLPLSHNALSDREREAARWDPERETLELAAQGAAKVLGADHGVTRALARASITMGKADLWRARLAVKTLRRDRREAIASAAEV